MKNKTNTLKEWNSKLSKMRKMFYKHSITVQKSKTQIPYRLALNLFYDIRILNPFGKLDIIFKNVRLIDLYKSFEKSLSDNVFCKSRLKEHLKGLPNVKYEVFEPFGE